MDVLSTLLVVTGVLVVVDDEELVIEEADVLVTVEVHVGLDTVGVDDWPEVGLVVALVAVDLVFRDVLAAETGAPASVAEVAYPHCYLWWLNVSELHHGRAVVLHYSFLIDT